MRRVARSWTKRRSSEALQQGWIAGAALDVFEDEPQVPQALMELENVVLVPHIGSASVATRTRMAVMAAENLVAVLRGEPTPHIVNPTVMARGVAPSPPGRGRRVRVRAQGRRREREQIGKRLAMA